MKILNISGKNLASLAGPFTVDFEQEPLASSGLFAISGPTGAGKSTLLDALCLALYDATPRLLKVIGRSSALPDVGSETVAPQDPRTLLRRGCAEGHAQVDFVGNDGKAYRARWNVRRARAKIDGSLQASTMSLHHLPELQAIGGTKTEVKQEIEQRIGLSFEQFTRAVLLAQNEFSTFLKTEDNDRGELLETLTGRTIYSTISMRAYERSRREQEALKRLNERLTDQKPLGPADRCALDEQHATACAGVASVDRRHSELEQQMRWHQEALKLDQNEQMAQLALQASCAEVAAASPQRAALAQLDAVQPARTLADDVTRIERDTLHTHMAIEASRSAASAAVLAQETAAAAWHEASRLLQDSEQLQRASAPQLDLAKALDARIEALLPSQRQAALACAGTQQAQLLAKGNLEQKRQQSAALDLAREAGSAWLARHQPWQALARSWPRWDVLFGQAGHAAAQEDKLAQSLAKAGNRTLACRAGADTAQARLDAAAAALAPLEAQRQAAIRSCAGFDGESIQNQRQQFEYRRDLLSPAEKIWTELCTKQARRDHLEAQTAQWRRAKGAAETALATEQAAAGAIMAAFAQAERSLKGAQAACADNVETLRATLEDEAPCPVCGALAHPYRHDNAALHAMLASLQSEVAIWRRQAQENIEHQATQRAISAASIEQLAALGLELRTLQEALEQIAPAWADAAAKLAVPDQADSGAWLFEQIELAKASLLGVGRQEQALRRANAVKDSAQLACDSATAEQVRALAAAGAAQTGLAQALAEHTALSDQRIAVNSQLAALLGELDAAFQDGDGAGVEWKDGWRSAPLEFHNARQADSRQWLAQQSAQDDRNAAGATALVELKALCDALAKTEHDANAARAAGSTLDAAVSGMQGERLALWGGKATHAIELELAASIELAKTAQQTRQSAVAEAQQTAARLNEALAQAVLRLTALHGAAEDAGTRLRDWLEQLLQRQPDCAAPGLEQLQVLLAIGADQIDAQRQALQALDAGAASARSVLTERQARREQHRQHGPENAGQTMDSVAQALTVLGLERKAAHDAASALQLALAQDDARRQHAHALLAEIEQQEVIARRWADLNDLIGSADGKKFRNYAQQFTLDVLLGYANAHLMQLARRYRLERIVNSASPSLGLMVRDQDMGGEQRSVHSLSGGESFLVSLALALGLASLSSNRVRVESLFIDEGFGSLDSDTLRVAMDALDGLQSMGRKVGVISHVQEMTDRIATKILVQPSAGGKSAVSVQ